LTFSVRQRIEFGIPCFGCERRINHPQTAMDPPYSIS
jgi:hypothetical protein